jgi:P27 family predicted phage terminase small subunit
MGLRGPAPKPSALKLLQGNAGHRAINTSEPKPGESAPPCPAYILADPEAAAEWERLVPILLSMRVLTEADATVLASLCLTHSHLLRNLEAMRQLNGMTKAPPADGAEDTDLTVTLGIAGMVVETKTGYLAANQIYLNVTAAIDLELKLCRELGLTPSARTRIQTTGNAQAQPENKWDVTRPIPTSKQA